MKSAAIAAAALSLALGCAAPAVRTADWPAELPPRDLFVRAWHDDAENRALQPLDDYLGWVVRFHAGSVLAPGWTGATRDLLRGLASEERTALEVRLDALGRLLAAEWAKDNRRRRIDSVRISQWASDLRSARREGLTLETLDRIARDAQARVSLALAGR